MNTPTAYSEQRTATRRLAAALEEAAGETHTFDHIDGENAYTIVVHGPKMSEPIRVTYSLRDALQAGHFEHEERRPWWTKYTTDMLYSACLRRVVARLFPSVESLVLRKDMVLEQGLPADVLGELSNIDGK